MDLSELLDDVRPATPLSSELAALLGFDTHPRRPPSPPPVIDLIDLTDDTPDVPPPPATPSHTTSDQSDQSEESCLLKVLEVFPDISREHVGNLDARHKANAPENSSSVRLEHIIEDILASLPYPTERSAKRKRSSFEEDGEDSCEEWQNDAQDHKSPDYIHVS